MGGSGSGRKIEKVGDIRGIDILMSLEDFKDYVEVKTIESFPIILDKLMEIITGKAEDIVFDGKNGRLIKRPPSLDVIVKAAKLYKEMTLDKIISDKKIVEQSDKIGIFDHLRMLNELEEVAKLNKKDKLMVEDSGNGSDG